MSAAYSSVGDRASRLVPVSARASVAIGLVSLVGLASFLWPLLVVPGSGFADATTAPLLLAALLPLFLVVVLAEVGRGGFDVKAIAMLGVLSAVGAVLRPLGAGTAGLETVFFLLILAGRVYGPGFGFVLGATTMFSSALLTGGVGPWLPFQMMAAAWVGLGAGLLPRVRGKAEICMLGAYGFVAGLVFGLLMNLSFWPFTVGLESQLVLRGGRAGPGEPASVPRVQSRHVAWVGYRAGGDESRRDLAHRPGRTVGVAADCPTGGVRSRR